MKAKKLYYLGFLVIIVILITSCEANRCIRGNDILVVEERQFNQFTGVVSEGIFDIQIIQTDTLNDSLNYIAFVDADENIHPYISMEIKGDNLEIEIVNNRCIRSARGINIDIYVPDLDYIELSGSGEIWCNYLYTNGIQIDLLGTGDIRLFDLDAYYVDAYLSGSGIIELEGDAIETDFRVPGSGQIRADNLRQYECYIDISGAGSILVFALDFIEGIISGTGSLYYKIFPHYGFEVDITGTGEIRPL